MPRGGAMPGAGRPRVKNPKKPVTVRMTDEDRKKAEKKAKAEGKSLSAWIVDRLK